MKKQAAEQQRAQQKKLELHRAINSEDMHRRHVALKQEIQVWNISTKYFESTQFCSALLPTFCYCIGLCAITHSA